MLKLLIDRGYLPKAVGSLFFWLGAVPLLLFFALVFGRIAWNAITA